MKAYSLGIDTRTNGEWRAILVKEENDKKHITDKLDRNEIVEASVINMFLTNIVTDKNLRKEKPFETDIIYWLNDLLLDAVTAQNGIIISSRLKSFLQKFKIGDHKFYDVYITNSADRDNTALYHLFQPRTEINDITNFSKSEFAFLDKSTRQTLKTEIGSFKDYSDFSKAEHSYYDKENIVLKITTRCLRKDLDVIYGFENNLVINEKLRTKIGESDFTGIEVKLYKDYEIVLD